MTEQQKRHTESRAIDTLLDQGFKVKIGWFNITIKQPPAATLLKISQVYLQMNIDEEKLKHGQAFRESYQLVSDNIKPACKIIAMAILRKTVRRMILTRIMSWYLLQNITSADMYRLLSIVVVTNNTADFIGSIRLIQTLRMMKPKEDLIESLKED